LKFIEANNSIFLKAEGNACTLHVEILSLSDKNKIEFDYKLQTCDMDDDINIPEY
jgi:hypothetical protein